MVGFRLLPETFVAGATRWWADEKGRIERMCISLPYVETFNWKLIKGFVPELRSRYVFFEFGDPMFYLYGHSMYVSHMAI